MLHQKIGFSNALYLLHYKYLQLMRTKVIYFFYDHWFIMDQTDHQLQGYALQTAPRHYHPSSTENDLEVFWNNH